MLTVSYLISCCDIGKSERRCILRKESERYTGLKQAFRTEKVFRNCWDEHAVWNSRSDRLGFALVEGKYRCY